MPFIKPTVWNSYFQILVEPHYEGNDDQFAKYCQTPRNKRFKKVFCCWSSVRHFGALTVKFAPNPIVAKNMANFLKHCHRPFIHCFPLVYLCVSCKQHFGDLTVKFLPNQITTYKMASLENIVTSLRITVLCYSYRAYNQNDTLELLPWNCPLTPLWRKRWSICKILSHASKLSFLFSYLVLIV